MTHSEAQDSSPDGAAEGADNVQPTITLPTGGGAIRGIGEKFVTNENTGTGTLTVPIAVSSPRSDFAPTLALVYNTGAGNGAFGFGWELPLPTITRKTDKGLPSYEDASESDVFILSSAEDLTPTMVLAGDGTWSTDETVRDGYRVKRYRPRVEGLFARIERWTRLTDGDIHWRTVSRNNVLNIYGWDLSSRIADPEAPERVFSWLICQSYDDKGNAIVFEYAAEDEVQVDLSAANERNRSRTANRYIRRIRYGNRRPLLIDPSVPSFRQSPAPPPDLSTADWMFDVVFDYGEGLYQEQPPDTNGRVFAAAVMTPPPGGAWPVRADPFSRYRSTFEVRTYRLCRGVLTFHHFPQELGTDDYLVRRTELQYEERPTGSFLTQIQQSGFKRQTDGRYLKQSSPPLALGYTPNPLLDPQHLYTLQAVDPGSLENLPAGLEARVRWVDLDGEGISGALREQGDAWYYKANLGNGTFAPLESVARRPSLARLEAGQQVLLDLAGDGNLDLVDLTPPTPGFYERVGPAGWLPFRPFASYPNRLWSDPNLRLFDVTGDGIADVLITEEECLTWHPSLGEQGFGPAVRVQLPGDEEKGPWVVFADPQRSIFVADLTGDGLPDIVRIRNGEVCYWPNLGYGRFGAKVTMDNAPVFESPDLYDPRRIRLADTDGTGTTDIVYLGHDGIQIYLNQSGNSWSPARVLDQFPLSGNPASVSVVDLLGQGTACLVWSSPLPTDDSSPMRYVDLMDGSKPHLLAEVSNNLGARTLIKYRSSTQDYLADKIAGQHWATRLPFPVHVVARVDSYDYIGRTRTVTRYFYHHGYFDGVEREFRGFGRVERLDTDELAALSASDDFAAADNVDAASYVPPVLTKSWFHTGAFFAQARVSRIFESEYFREDTLTDAQDTALRLADSALPANLAPDELRQAFRSLKGALLRREIYALDDGPDSHRPYTVEEQNYAIRTLQPRLENPFAVFLRHPRELIHFDYERTAPADPRVQHRATLAADDFGNALLSVFVAYGRRGDAPPDPLLTAADQQVQGTTRAVFTVNTFTNAVLLDDAYRAPAPSESQAFELLNVTPSVAVPGITNLFRYDELNSLITASGDGAHDIPFENFDGSGVSGTSPYRRMISHVRILYRANDLTGALPLGQIQALALPFSRHQLALTQSYADELYVSGGQLSAAELDTALTGSGGYVHSNGDSGWWAPSTEVFYSPNPADTPAQELTQALAHFFLPRSYRDPFGATVTFTYDSHDLLPLEIVDALGNRVTAGVRHTNGALSQVGNDYRVLHPALVMDPNRNRSAVAFDALGNVVGSAVMGKPEEQLGDSLDGFDADLTDAVIQTQLTNPLANPQALLQRATARTIVDLFAFARTGSSPTPQPAVLYTMARETHDADLSSGGTTRIQHRFEYSDGFGREIQRKVQAAAGPLVSSGPPVDPRWSATGWTVFNNKGSVVRQYEPFFDDRATFNFGTQVGVSPIVFYDPLSRPAVIVHPNHTVEKRRRTPWRDEHWDINDTVLLDPKTDPDTSAYVSRLPDIDYLPTWYDQRQGGALGSSELDSANKTAIHANTPELRFRDALGRVFLTVAHNRYRYTTDPPATVPTEAHYRALIVFDIDGNERRLIDAQGRTCASYEYDMLGHRVLVRSMESGERRVLVAVGGLSIRAWDSRGHAFTMTYDPLRRPVSRSVAGTDAAESDPRTLGKTIVFEKLEYGEGTPGDEAANVRTHLIRVSDGAGVVTTDLYDFKSNALRSRQSLLQDYKDLADWSATPALEPQSYVNLTTFDALNRVQTLSTPDGSLTTIGYDAGNRLNALTTNVRGAATAMPFVRNIAYDAKGQRTRIDYGNGTSTAYEYDPLTFAVMHIKTTRVKATNGVTSQLLVDSSIVQDLHYTYDPIGNITALSDLALQTTFFNNEQVSPEFPYNYDAIYRLIEAGGREHAAQAAFYTPPDGNFRDYPFAGVTAFSDFQALRNYSERYEYDEVGNPTLSSHRATAGNWQRAYRHLEVNPLEPTQLSNRLSQTVVQPDGQPATTEAFTYNTNGCITQMAHLPVMKWDFKNRLSAASRQVVNTQTSGRVPETTYFTYSAADTRTRKVTERQNGTRKSERIYLLNTEIYREYGADGQTVTATRETLHVMDDRQRIALIETDVSPTGNALAPPILRFQVNNHLGSACTELDGSGALISYEEYTPYGSPAFQAGRSAVEVALKRYRFTSKERDGETGFTYHGARYYAPWLARWISCDPDGLSYQRNLPPSQRVPRESTAQPSPSNEWNLYRYARDNPLVYSDPTGRFDAKVLIPTATLGVAALTLFGLESTGVIRMPDGKWVTKGESRLFDWWTIGHYLFPAFVASMITIALQNWTHLKSEDILAIAGLSATALAFGYELIERPLWSAIHKATRPGTRLGDLDLLLISGTRIHEESKGAALEYRTNTVGDVVIGSIGAFTASYTVLAAYRRTPDSRAFWLWGGLGVGSGLVLTAAVTYGGVFPTKETHEYDPDKDVFYRKP